MASLVTNFINGYNDLLEKRHPRSDGYFLMSSPVPTTLICIAYVYFVKSLGPKLMKNRQPFELKKAIQIYNILQVIVSSYIVYGGLRYAWIGRYSYRCQPIDWSDDPNEIAGFDFCYIYFLCKIVEFLDTIFFVLRKKFDQITHLHVIHHTIMAGAVWWGTKFAPSGHGTFFGLINSFVHVIMYSYYLLASMGPEYQKYLWWKKHLTSIQMIQFIIVFLHNFQVLISPDCDYPRGLVYVMLFNSVMFLALFSNFYFQAYIKKRRLPNIKKEDDSNRVKQQRSRDAINNNNNSVAGTPSKITGFLSKAVPACFIGQNGLISEKSIKSSENKKFE